MGKDPRNRALRTLLQFIVSAVFTETISTLVVNLDTSQKVVILALMQLVVSYAQNELEDRGWMPTVGKQPTE